MKLISKLSMFVVVMAMFAFTSIDPSSIAGKYGEKETVKMEISFTESGEFTYVDKSNAENPLTVSGKWTADKDVITLSDFGTAQIPTQWKFDEKNRAVKSRQGVTFYRLADSTAKKSCCASKGEEGKSCADKKK